MAHTIYTSGSYINGVYQTGEIDTFGGANGLLQALLDFVCGTKVLGITLSGSGTGPYTATLTTPVGLGSVQVTYVIATLEYVVADDGTGTISGDNITSGTINYDTGALSVTFDSTPDSTPTCDYLYGDEGKDWELKYQRNTRNDNELSPSEPFSSDLEENDLFECILHNRGISGAENVLTGFREWKYPGGDARGWNLTGYLAYSDDMFWGSTLRNDLSLDDYDDTWNNYEKAPSIPLINDTMYYWFYSNRQRIVVGVKVQSNYESGYFGFANRVGNPADYPYPLVIRGCIHGNVNYAYVDISKHAFLPKTSLVGEYLLNNVLPDNSWSLNQNISPSIGTYFLPYTYWSDGNGTMIISENPPKKEVLATKITGVNIESNFTLWELDGVNHVAGIGVQSEDFVNGDDGVKYRVFQDVSRVTYKSFMCVGELDYTSTSTTTTTTTTA